MVKFLQILVDFEAELKHVGITDLPDIPELWESAIEAILHQSFNIARPGATQKLVQEQHRISTLTDAKSLMPGKYLLFLLLKTYHSRSG